MYRGMQRWSDSPIALVGCEVPRFCCYAPFMSLLEPRGQGLDPARQRLYH